MDCRSSPSSPPAHVRPDQKGESSPVEDGPRRCKRAVPPGSAGYRFDGPARTHHPPRPRIEDHREVDEAARDGDVSDIGDPELVRGGENEPTREGGKDRAVVLAVGGARETPRPYELRTAILSRIRSPITSRSNWANESRTFSVRRSSL